MGPKIYQNIMVHNSLNESYFWVVEFFSSNKFVLKAFWICIIIYLKASPAHSMCAHAFKRYVTMHYDFNKE